MEKNWLRRLDLQEEPIPGLPIIEIAGNRRVLIEHHCGVTQYGCRSICVNVKNGCVCIEGSNLELSKMTAKMLIISGCIDCVRLERRR